jgi:integrase
MRGLKAPETMVDFWTESQLLGFLRAVPEDEPAYAMFYVFAFTGLRRGELIGLHWTDLEVWSGGSDVLQIRSTVRWSPNRAPALP